MEDAANLSGFSPHHYGVRMAQSSPSKETMNMNLRVDFPKTFSFVTTENFAAVLETVSLFAKNANATVDIALESLELTQALFAVLPTFVHVVATHDTLADVRVRQKNEKPRATFRGSVANSKFSASAA
jgi:hypothetical protein